MGFQDVLGAWFLKREPLKDKKLLTERILFNKQSNPPKCPPLFQRSKAHKARGLGSTRFADSLQTRGVEPTAAFTQTLHTAPAAL